MPKPPVVTGSSSPSALPDKRFLCVKNGETSTVTKGQVMAISSVADDGITVVLCDIDAAATICPIGVVYPENGIAASEYGLIQTHGYCDFVAEADNSVTADQFLIPSATAGDADGGNGTTYVACTFGYALADAAGGTVKAMLLGKI